MSNTNIAPMLMNPKDTNWYFFTLPAFLGTKTLLDTYLVCSILAAFLSLAFLTWALSTGGGIAWTNGRNCRGRVHIPGPRGFPVVGSLLTLGRGLAHRTLASMAWSQGCTQLMALSLGGTTPLVVASDPTTAREILTSSGFADRPIKQSAKSLMFERAIGFAPNGTYWRLLRKIASTHLLSPHRISAHEGLRQAECTVMLQNITKEVGASGCGMVSLRSHLQLASLNNIMGTVFGKRYDAVEELVKGITVSAFLGTKTLLDTYLVCSILAAFLSLAFLTWALSTGGGIAWTNGRNCRGRVHIPGPRGFPVVGSLLTLGRGLAHHTLASMAWSQGCTQLMALSLGGTTPLVVASDPTTAREILTSPGFADRPIKQSAKCLMFERAIGFAPNGTYWRLLRRIASTHLLSPRRISAHEGLRQAECTVMLQNIAKEVGAGGGTISLRSHLQLASLNNIMGTVFGKRYDAVEDRVELNQLEEMVREGFDLLGAFNWSDYLPWLSWFYDPFRVNQRCSILVPRVKELVKELVKGIIEEHRGRGPHEGKFGSESGDFVDVLLSLEGEERLEEDDMISVLWEMIFRGTDTTALLTEWVMTELVLHPKIQQKLRTELQNITSSTQNDFVSSLTDIDLSKSPYLQAIVKETLRVHPPGPLLSWARLSTSDVHLSNGMLIPAHTTAMVNMWAITHDPQVWANPLEFRPERFLEEDVDVRGCDLRLAPFGAGRRVCPGKNLGMVTVAMWVAKLVVEFEWFEDPARPVDLGEVLKLSCEMKHPLHVVVVPL